MRDSSKLITVTIAASSLLIALAIGCSKKEEAASTKDSGAVAAANTSVDTAKKSEPAPAAATMTGAAAVGQKIFYNTGYGKVKNACSSCHTDGQPTTKDTRLRAGHTLAGVTNRMSTWNGQFKGDGLAKNAYGATMCAVMYQHKGDNMATVMPKGDIDALNAYYDAIKSSPGAMTSDLKIAWVTKPAVHDSDPIDDKAANAAGKAIMKLPGDPAAGKSVFDRTCAYCHALKEKKVGPSLEKAMKDPQMGARTVRVGSGAMPFYAKDLLTDQQVADVISYIQQQLGK